MDVEEGIEMEVEALDEHDLIDEDLVEYEEEDASDEETTIIYQEDVEEEGQVYIEEDDYDEEEMVETALPPPAKNAINSLEKKTNITIKRVDNNKPQVTTQLVQQPKQIIKRLDNGKVVIVQQSVSVPRILNASAPSTITTPSTSVKSTPPYTFVKKEDGSFVKVNKQAPTTPTQVVKTMVSTTSEGGQIVRKVIVKQAPAQQIRASVPERQVLNAITKKPVSPVPVSSKATTPKLVFQQGGKTIIAKPSATSSGTPQKIVLSQQQLKAGQASGEIQAINIPGKGIQYVRLLNKVDAASKAAEKNENIIKIGSASTPKTYGKQIASPQKKTNVALSKQLEGLSGSAKIVAVVKKDGHSTETDTSKVSSLTTTQLNQLQGAQIITGANNTKIVMLPSDYLEQLKKIQVKKPVQIKIENDSPAKSPNTTLDPDLERFKYGAESDGYKKRACNCTKSQCLKLYCDCFANGEFCYNCNCKDCFNNLENEDERQKAIRATLERNPLAFKPKIGATISDENDMLRKHTKGCNCKRSGCLKNYCECYEAKIVCGHNCKCVGCRNTEDNIHNFSTFSNEPMGKPVNLNSGMKRKSEDSIPPFPPNKQPYNFMTPDVIEATVQCMIAQADECQKRGCSIRTAERMILEEFGRCLVEIIDFSGKNDS